MNRRITCAICGEKRQTLSYHIRKHGLTAREYKRQYGYLSYQDKLVEKINDIFISSRQKWLSYWVSKDNPQIKGIYTHDSSKEKNPHLNRPLTDRDIRLHLAGKPTIGIRERFVSKYLCFDIDSAKSKEDGSRNLSLTREVTRKLIDELTKYFQPEDCHCEFSGNKGWHIWLFFNRQIDIDLLVAFGKHVSAFNLGNPEVNIERRPEGKDGRGIKLPLGFHPETKALCIFVDKSTFIPVPDPYEYLLGIKRIEPIDFSRFYLAEKQKEIIHNLGKKEKQPTGALEGGESKAINGQEKDRLRIETTLIPDKSELKRIWELGLPFQGIRHRYTFLLAMWLREQGYDRETVKKLLYEFTDREFLAGRTKDSAEKSKRDIDSTVDNVFDNNLALFQTELTDFENSLFSFFPAKTHGTLETVFKIAKTAPVNNGYFFISLDRVAQEIKKTTRTVKRHLAEFEDKILFRAFTGIPRGELQRLRREIIGQLPADTVFHMDKRELELFLQPEAGLNSLYYMPIIRQGFTRNVQTPDFIKVVNYSWYRFRLSCIESENVLYKYRILLGIKPKASNCEERDTSAFFGEEINLLKLIIENLQRYFREQDENPGFIAEFFKGFLSSGEKSNQ